MRLIDAIGTNIFDCWVDINNQSIDDVVLSVTSTPPPIVTKTRTANLRIQYGLILTIHRVSIVFLVCGLCVSGGKWQCQRSARRRWRQWRYRRDNMGPMLFMEPPPLLKPAHQKHEAYTCLLVVGCAIVWIVGYRWAEILLSACCHRINVILCNQH